jgi:DNA-binding XRE family transcriptional regulator
MYEPTGLQLRQGREVLKLTQWEVAHDACINQTAVSNIERDKPAGAIGLRRASLRRALARRGVAFPVDGSRPALTDPAQALNDLRGMSYAV